MQAQLVDTPAEESKQSKGEKVDNDTRQVQDGPVLEDDKFFRGVFFPPLVDGNPGIEDDVEDNAEDVNLSFSVGYLEVLGGVGVGAGVEDLVPLLLEEEDDKIGAS